MGDRPAERSLRGGGGIDVDELMVLGRIGEGVDALLVDQDPVGQADLAADLGADGVEGGDGHRRIV